MPMNRLRLRFIASATRARAPMIGLKHVDQRGKRIRPVAFRRSVLCAPQAFQLVHRSIVAAVSSDWLQLIHCVEPSGRHGGNSTLPHPVCCASRPLPHGRLFRPGRGWPAGPGEGESENRRYSQGTRSRQDLLPDFFCASRFKRRSFFSSSSPTSPTAAVSGGIRAGARTGKRGWWASLRCWLCGRRGSGPAARRGTKGPPARRSRHS
jgi:hypothetical protein